MGKYSTQTVLVSRHALWHNRNAERSTHRSKTMPIAITRQVSPAIARCELTHLERVAIDVELAQAQHRQYEVCLAALGCEVQSLPAEPDLPDSVFIEDAAIVLDELAIITRPGADSRRPETVSIARALEPYRRLVNIEAPSTVDGGDVLRVGKTLYVGLSSRSNPSAIEQMQSALRPYGYTVQGVPVQGCLHLKSAVTQAAEDALLINPNWVDKRTFRTWRLIEVDAAEPYAGNALLIGGTLIYPASFPRTRERLEAHDIHMMTVDVSELAKAEGAVTCCSLVFEPLKH
jgi:dimethylargininase